MSSKRNPFSCTCIQSSIMSFSDDLWVLLNSRREYSTNQKVLSTSLSSGILFWDCYKSAWLFNGLEGEKNINQLSIFHTVQAFPD